MKLWLSLLCFTTLVWSPRGSIAQGTVQNLSFFSNALGKTEQFQLYLPPGYDPAGSAHYPVIYFLHGSTFNSKSYPCLLDSIDVMIQSGAIKPVIVVKPNGNQGPYLGSMYTNSSLNGNVEDYIISDLIDYIDTHYKTKPSRQYRCIFGHSMGAMGAAYLALKHPDKFRAFASLSGAMNFKQMDLFIQLALAVDHPSGPPYTFIYNPVNQLLTGLLFTASSGYSPNPAGTPPVYFPVNNEGQILDSVLGKWGAFDPALAVIQSPPDTTLGIYFDCGQQDEFRFYPMNQGFRDSLEKVHAKYIFRDFQGGHGNKICERMALAMRYLDSMITAPIVPVFQPDVQESMTLMPNPATDAIKIPGDWALPLEVSIYNLQGQQQLKTILEQPNAEINIRHLQAGAYFVQARGKNKWIVGKLIKQ